ncbi:MAG TPA: glycosyltransferase, partial [Pirellulales bacterium]
MRQRSKPRSSPSRAVRADESDLGPKARAQRLLAEYLRVWGLRDPQVIAEQTRLWVDQTAADDSAEAAPAEFYRKVVRRAVGDMDERLDHLTRSACSDGEAVASQRGLVALEFQSLIDKNPTALLNGGPLDERLHDRFRAAVHPVVPKASPTPMPVQAICEGGAGSRLAGWRRLMSAVICAAGWLLTFGWFSMEGSEPESGAPRRRPRVILALLTLLTTACGAAIFTNTIGASAGLWSLALVPLFVVLFLWVSMSFWLATMGFTRCLALRPPKQSPPRQRLAGTQLTARTALVMPVYNESPQRAFAGIRAIYESVQATGQGGSFDFFILSDSTDSETWLAEELAWARLVKAVTGESRVFYRHRPKNIARKSGNIADFCERWGAQYRYMIVLDADSMMSGETIREMVHRMEDDPAVGILQVPPVPVNRESLFAR